MVEPNKQEDALIEAEKICHAKVCEILGLQSGVDCFISTNPGKTDCAIFDIGFLWTGDQAGWPSQVYHFRAKLDLYSRNRAKVQRWLMRLLLAMPISPWQGQSNELDQTTTVRTFRIAPESNGVGEITTTELKEAANVNGVEVFTAGVNFDIIFGVGTRSAPV